MILYTLRHIYIYIYYSFPIIIITFAFVVPFFISPNSKSCLIPPGDERISDIECLSSL